MHPPCMSKPQPYLERWRLEKLEQQGGNNSGKCTHPTNNGYDLQLYCDDRNRWLTYLKHKNMIHQKSTLPFRMFFNADCLEGYFYLDKAYTQMVFTSKVNPHAIIDAETAELKPPAAGNAISVQTQFNNYGMLQENNCIFKHELTGDFWSVNGVDAQKTCFLDSEIQGCIEASDDDALEAVNHRRRSGKAKPKAPSENSIDKVSEPCLDSPRTPKVNEIKPALHVSLQKSWIGMVTKEQAAANAKKLKETCKARCKRELSSPKITQVERVTIEKRQKADNAIERRIASELKDYDEQRRAEKKKHKKEQQKMECN